MFILRSEEDEDDHYYMLDDMEGEEHEELALLFSHRRGGSFPGSVTFDPTPFCRTMAFHSGYVFWNKWQD